jgi:DNA-binding MarR family transcriptional regulator
VTDVDLSCLGLAPQTARVLALISAEGWTTAHAIAAQLSVSRSVVIRALDQLVEQGYVERTRGRRSRHEAA